MHFWDIYHYGIGDGGQYLGAYLKTKSDPPPYAGNPGTNAVCKENGEWIYINAQTHPKLFENELYREAVHVKTKLIHGPTSASNCSCIFTWRGNMISKTLVEQKVIDLDYRPVIQVNGDYSNYYWQYFVDGKACGNKVWGFERYKPARKAHIKIYHAEWEKEHTCCGSNAPFKYTEVEEFNDVPT